MKQCPNCRADIRDEALFCPICGTSIEEFHSFPEPYPPQESFPFTPVYPNETAKENPLDKTKTFDSEDIARNKLVCMMVYLFDILGIFLGLLAAKDSPYVQFHIRESMKYSILEALIVFLSAVAVWTVVVPVVGVIALAVLTVFKAISFCRVCRSRAVETSLFGKIKFLN